MTDKQPDKERRDMISSVLLELIDVAIGHIDSRRVDDALKQLEKTHSVVSNLPGFAICNNLYEKAVDGLRYYAARGRDELKNLASGDLWQYRDAVKDAVSVMILS